MKQKFVYLFIAALFIGLFGCQREQSELDFGSLQEKALVTGRVTYSLGQDTLSDDYVAERILPAVGRKIYVEIPMSSYQAGAQGNKIFTGVVDSLGNFSIEVPVKSEGIPGATLRYEEFTAERATYLKMENGKPVFEVRMCKFETPAAIASLPTLMPGSNHIGEEADLRYDYTIIDMKDYSETAVFTGKLLLPYEVSYHTGAYKAAADCAVEITIQDGEDLEEKKADAEKFTYGCTTDANGVFSVNLPIKNLRKGFEVVSATVVPVGDAAFVHYTNVEGASIKVAGAYQLREGVHGINELIYETVVDEVVEGIECNVGEWALEFIPGYNNSIASTTDPLAWDRNLAGWVFGEKDFASMTATSTLTGTLKLSQETAFAIGSYATSVQSLKITGNKAPYDKTFTVVSKADGTFELPLPVEQEGVNPGVSWNVELNQPNPIAFTHYSEPAKSIVLKEGTYTQYEKLRAVDAEWNQLGDFYFKFAPTGTVESWNADLAGWYVKKDYEETATVTAKLYVAQETAFAIGAYKAAKDLRVSVDVVYPDEVATLVAPVKADGTLTLVVPAKSANSEYTADAFTLLDNKLEDYKHYTKKGEKALAGEYTLKYKFEDKEGDWNNKYTLYYSFAPTTAPTTWHADLAGWYKKDGYDKSATATGKAFFAKEKSYGVGEYVAAANEVVTVSVAQLGADLQVPVKADGTFSVVIPMKDAFDEYTLTASAAGVEVDDFIHYKDHGKTQTLEGEYAAGSPLKADDAAWNDLGTYYFKFDPNGADPDPKTFHKELLGWQMFDATYANKDKEVSGTIMYAKETGFRVGTYEAYAKEKVKVSYTLDGNDFVMIVLTDETGKFTCPTYRQFGDQEPAVAAVPLLTEVDDFVHYYHVTSPTPMKVEGDYAHYQTLNANAWNNKGTAYYKFHPTSSATEWTDDLLGWYKLPNAEGKATFKLYAQKAFESTTSGAHEADWEAAGKGVMATVTLTRGSETKSFDMLVSTNSLNLSGVPFMQEVKDGDSFTVQIELTHSSNLAGYPAYSTFKHYADPAEDKVKTISGKYVGAPFTAIESVVNDNGTVEIKKSAKLIFNPTTTPDGWSSYNWYAILDHTIED